MKQKINYQLKIDLINTIEENGYDLGVVFNLTEKEIENTINKNFSKFEKSLRDIFIEYKYFKKGEIDGTGWAKSGKVIKTFEESLLLSKNYDISDFNNKVLEYYLKNKTD